MTIPPELKEAEVSCEWIFRVMLKDARKLPSRTWLTPDDVASFLEAKQKELKEKIEEHTFCDYCAVPFNEQTKWCSVSEFKKDSHVWKVQLYRVEEALSVFGGERK